MKKEIFNKLSKSEKKIAIIKDVLLRLKKQNIVAERGDFMKIPYLFEGKNNFNLKDFINNKETKDCEVCAKGALFCSWVGINNEFTSKDNVNAENDSKSILVMSSVFTLKQLSLIETAFECKYFPWNEKLTDKEIDKCSDFGEKYQEDGDRLVAILKNMLKNNGVFKP